MRRRTIASLALPLLLLVACEARQSYPDGYTDTDLWNGPPIRVDTEVPNQYPDGSTRDALLHDALEGGAAAH